MVACFRDYQRADGLRVFRAEVEANLAGRPQDRVFTTDLGPLLAAGVEWDLDRAARFVRDEIAPRLSAKAWKALEASEQSAYCSTSREAAAHPRDTRLNVDVMRPASVPRPPEARKPGCSNLQGCSNSE